MQLNYRIRLINILLLLFIVLTQSACKYKVKDLKNVSFKPVIGIGYTEVRRRLNTGRSFDNYGYEVNPEWRMTFISKDSTSIFSPDSNRFLTFPLMLDHDSLFYTGNTWLRAKKVTKDSLIFQVMQVETNVIYLLHSNVYMTFYANDYIKRKNLNLTQLQQPDHLDTVFVKQRAMLANKYPDTLFAAREPVVMKSKSPFVKVEKEIVPRTRENHYDTSDSYMDPKYDVTIHHAYQDFDYSFNALVDTNGQIHFVKSLIYTLPEYRESTIKIIKGIIDGYLKVYVSVKPGSTLGIVHTSMVTINVDGRKK
jgi:hypothetical protein